MLLLFNNLLIEHIVILLGVRYKRIRQSTLIQIEQK